MKTVIRQYQTSIALIAVWLCAGKTKDDTGGDVRLVRSDMHDLVKQNTPLAATVRRKINAHFDKTYALSLAIITVAAALFCLYFLFNPPYDKNLAALSLVAYVAIGSWIIRGGTLRHSLRKKWIQTLRSLNRCPACTYPFPAQHSDLTTCSECGASWRLAKSAQQY